jgi:serine phosphatase RsbU (regulator of sigma subunit)
MKQKDKLINRIEKYQSSPLKSLDETSQIVQDVLEFCEENQDNLHDILDVILEHARDREKHFRNIIDIILEYSTKISKESDSDSLLLLLADFGKTLVKSDRATLWLIDSNEQVFWTKVGHGISNIKIPLTMGIIGEVYEGNKTVIVNDPYNYPKFNREIDKTTNYKTDSILATPIFNKENRMIGVFQAINKLNVKKQFGNEDSELFTIAISYIRNILDMDHLAESNKYFIQEQTKAAQKQQSMLVNELENSEVVKVFIYFKPYDFLSGDSYSLHKSHDGGLLFYVLDAMGHGIVPSLTSFSVLSFVKQSLDEKLSFQETADAFGKSLEYILSDLEQLSASFFYIPPDFSYIEYFTAGMYPAVVHDGERKIELKANNIPFMNFFFSIKVTRIELENFKSILIYSDGLVEDSFHALEKEEVLELTDRAKLEETVKIFEDKQLEDDLTAVLIEKR